MSVLLSIRARGSSEDEGEMERNGLACGFSYERILPSK